MGSVVALRHVDSHGVPSQYSGKNHQGDSGSDRLPEVDQGEVGRQGPPGARTW